MRVPAIDITDISDISGLADVTFAEQIRTRQDSLRASLQTVTGPDQTAPWTREAIRAQGYTDIQAERDEMRTRADHLDSILLGRLNSTTQNTSTTPA